MQDLNLDNSTRKHHKIAVYALAAMLMTATNAALSQDWHGNIGGFIGSVTLDNKDWDNHDEMGSIGMIADFKTESSPVSIAIDLIGSGDEEKSGTSIKEAYSAALHLGVRKVFDKGNTTFKPYLGGGLALVNVEMRNKNRATSTSRIDDDSATGFWVGVGSYIEISDHFQAGLDLRYSEADVKLFDVERQAGGLQTAIVAGYHW
jgi:opacity protein-like surface antigen